jgi:CelD/BcsL family acetyltransferase involved in cellulose biosynthesis
VLAVPDEAKPLRKGQLPLGLRLTHITTLQSLERLGPQWRALEATSSVRPTIFQSFDWVWHWCQEFACPESKVEISIVAGYRGDELVFIGPWQKAYRRGIHRLVWLTYPMAQYGDILCKRGEDVRLWLDAAFALLKRAGGYDILHLRHVRDTSALHPYAVQYMQDGRLNEKAPWMDYTVFENIEAYDNRLSRTQKKHRKNVRAHIKKLGEMVFEHIGPGERLNAVIDLALAEKRVWLENNGRVSSVISNLRHDELMKSLAQRGNGDIAIDVTQLSVDGRALSWEIGLRYGKTHYCYIISRLNINKDQSPGRLHFDLNQRRTLEQGYTAFDLLSPNDAYKESWSNKFEPVNDYYFPLTRWGSLYGRLYVARLRPVLRSIYKHVPFSLKRLAAR